MSDNSTIVGSWCERLGQGHTSSLANGPESVFSALINQSMYFQPTERGAKMPQKNLWMSSFVQEDSS